MKSILKIMNETFYVLCFILSLQNLVCSLHLQPISVQTSQYEVIKSHMWLVITVLDNGGLAGRPKAKCPLSCMSVWWVGRDQNLNFTTQGNSWGLWGPWCVDPHTLTAHWPCAGQDRQPMGNIHITYRPCSSTCRGLQPC